MIRTVHLTFYLGLAALVLLAIGGLFTLYQSPLMEIYLANWALC